MLLFHVEDLDPACCQYTRKITFLGVCPNMIGVWLDPACCQYTRKIALQGYELT